MSEQRTEYHAKYNAEYNKEQGSQLQRKPKKQRKKYRVAAGVLIFVLFLPLLLQTTTFLKKNWLWPLRGFQEPKKIVYDGYQDLLSQKFQSSFDEYVGDQLLAKSFFIRFRNQVHFSFFSKHYSKKAFQTPDNVWFEKDHIEAHLGKDRVEVKVLEKQIKAVAQIDESLRRHHKRFFVVLAPSKAAVYPHYFEKPHGGGFSTKEEVPAKEAPAAPTKKENNYRLLLRLLQENKIDFLDLLDYTKFLTGFYGHLAYSRYGTHWSMMSAHYALDQLILFWNQKNSSLPRQRLPEFVVHDREYSILPQGTDADIFDSLNLFFDWPFERYLYFKAKLNSPQSQTVKPKVLFVGDSFYFTLANTKLLHALFHSESEFWYYGKERHFFNQRPALPVDKIFWHEFDAIILLVSEVNFKWFGYGFIEKMLSLK